MTQPTKPCPSEQSSALHALGLISTREAMWVYGPDGKPQPNPVAMFDEDGEPKF